MKKPFRDIYGNKYNSLEDIPEGSIFDKLNLSEMEFTELPEKLATITVRLLNLEECKSLTSLKGLPKGLKKLNCSDTSITSLEGLPEGLKEINCTFCNSLETLKGCPESVEKIKGSFCRSLKTLENCPKGLKVLYCSRAPITSLKGLPQGLRVFECIDTNITLEGLPRGLKVLYCSCNKITSLKGVPNGIKIIYCKICANLTSLENVPKGIEKINCEGCNKIEYIPDYIPNKAIKGLPKEKIAECKANWKKEHERKLALERQKAEIVKRFMKVTTAACNANKTDKVHEQ